MKSIVYQLLIIISISLVTFSCSSDPCDTVICDNGDCVDGTCACEEGFLGPTCSEIDLLGVYYSSDIVMDDNCSQAYKDYDPVLKGEIECDDLGCSSFYYTFLEDGIYLRTLKDYDEDSNGNFVETYSQTNEGTYSVNGIEITMLTGFSKGVVFKYEKTKLTAYYSFFQDCFATRHYTKRQ